LSLPILINSKTDLEATGIPSQKGGKGAVFLMDSEQMGETSSMVEIFMEKMKNEGFRRMINEEFATYSDACIKDFLEGDVQSLFQNMKQLSKIVLGNFKPMIPVKFHQMWQKGLDSGDYYLKLCGSGGGGYFLGFTEDYKKTQEILKNYKLELVYRF
jgi:mevalonate kinase